MEGRAEAYKAEGQRDLAHAWHVAVFSGAASVGKLKGLQHYLRTPDENRDVQNAKLLAALRSLKNKGVPMEIVEIEWPRKQEA